MSNVEAAASDTATPAPRNDRRRLLTILAVAVAIGAIAYGLYWLLYARHFESTNDAYVGGDIVAITSRENATVLALHADNTQSVRRGQLLIEFEPITAKVNMDAAEANLARTVRSVRTDFSKVAQARAQLNAARVSLAQAQSDYRRRASAGNAVSGEELHHARDAVAGTQANVVAAQSALAQAEAAVQGTAVASNPDVLAAIAKLRQAAITLGHMKLTAPVDGVVAQRTVQIGQQVAPGTPLMAVVPLQSVWIDANFKEGQLEDMRIGQPAEITADIYGGGVTYHGKIIGLGAGSGSAFALLPPQNASGNWIKIVQRVPVRIALDPKELRDHPLRVGLSVDVSVDVRDTSGAALASSRTVHEMRGEAGDDGGAATDALIKRILSQNGA
ncbi:MAG TPA: efflux RND transporter periplasmic adaptor subunit [Rhizomicrobium sp.]|nr:efflux RND transporter periplasmic adaptor subunit [Rhizomicrobium sp.]